MTNIFHQSVEDILRAATPEQRILWNYIFLRFGERISISQYCFSGTIAGELTVYTARKIYLAYEMQYSYNGSSVTTSSGRVMAYDELNAFNFSLDNSYPAWDATAAAMRYLPQTGVIKNIWFSRIVAGLYNTIHFKGYRIIY